MNIYWFGRHLDKDLGYMSDLLEDSGFYGWLLPYASGLADPFVRIARDLKTDQNLKYLVAVRPYTISPQYLLAISKSLDLIQEDRVRINFVPGLTEGEEYYGGILSDINDGSSFADRKKHFCTYIEEFQKLKGDKAYTYISGMADEICPKMLEFGDANIVSYGRLVEGKLEGYSKDTIIFFPAPSIEDFYERLNKVKDAGFNNIMIHTNGDRDFELATRVFKEIKTL
jgi:hypothetical protein